MGSDNQIPLYFAVDKNIKPGWFLFVQGRGIYKILQPDPKLNTRLIIPVECVNKDANERISSFTVAELNKLSNELEIPPLFEPTLEALEECIQKYSKQEGGADAAAPIDDYLLKQADDIISHVKIIQDLLNEQERQSFLRGIPFKKAYAWETIIPKIRQLGIRGINRSSFYRKLRLVKCYGGDRVAIASSLKSSKHTPSELSLAQQNLMDSIIMKYASGRGNTNKKITLYRILEEHLEHTKGWWVDPQKCGPDGVPPDLVDKLLDPNLPFDTILTNSDDNPKLMKILKPSRGWFYQYSRWFKANPEQRDKKIIDLYGERFFEQNVATFDTYVSRASLPLQYVFADHCLLDNFIVDNETRSEPFRVWITVLIDAWSRYILGFEILLENPCVESIQSALKCAIWPKNELLQELGLDYLEGRGWEFYGIPLCLSLDNAWAHHSHSLEHLCRDISQGGKFNSVELDFRPPYKGRYGALIERFFGNIQAKLGILPGSIKESSPNGVRNAVKEACLLFHDLKREMVKLIVEYIHHPHSELMGMSPHQKWLEGLGSGWPQVPPCNLASQRLFLRRHPDTRCINKRGISVFGLDYWAHELSRHERIGRNGKSIQYSIGYDPTNISWIAVYKDGKFICDLYAKKLRLPDGTYLHTSLAEMKLAKRIAKTNQNNNQNWLLYINDAKKLSDSRKGEQRMIRRKLRHVKQEDSIAPATQQTASTVVSTQLIDEQLKLIKLFNG